MFIIPVIVPLFSCKASPNPLESIVLIDITGNFVISSNLKNPSTEDITKKDWYASAISDDSIYHFSSPHIQDIFDSSSAEVITVTKITEYYVNGTKYRGILVVDLNFSSITTLAGTTNLGSGGHLVILDDDGSLIYSNKDTCDTNECSTLKIAELIIGYDHRFGKSREGNFQKLQELGEIYNFKVREISKQDISNITVSSTKIRKAIENGEMEKANSYLGYHFMLTGKVVKGENLGEKLGFPTANLFIKETYKLIPKTGAYIVKSKIENKIVFGMMNIGNRPTVSGKHQTIEIHFFDFNKNLYNTTIQIDVLVFLREEQKFDSVEALKIQLQKDKEKSLKIISGTFFELK